MQTTDYPRVYKGIYSDFLLAVASAEGNAQNVLRHDFDGDAKPYEIEYFIGERIDEVRALARKYCPIIVRTIIFENELSKQSYLSRKQQLFNQKLGNENI